MSKFRVLSVTDPQLARELNNEIRHGGRFHLFQAEVPEAMNSRSHKPSKIRLIPVDPLKKKKKNENTASMSDPAGPLENCTDLFLWSKSVDRVVLEHSCQQGHTCGTGVSKLSCISFCPFAPYQNFALVGDVKGKIALIEVGPAGIECGEPQSTESSCTHAVGWMKNSRGQIVGVCTEKQETLVIWRVKFGKRSLRVQSRCLDVITVSNNKNLRCLATHPDYPNLVATAGQSGIIFIFQNNLIFPTHKIKKAHYAADEVGSKRTEVLGLVFKDDKTIISAGAADKRVKVWSLDQSDSSNQPNMIACFVLSMEVSSIALAKTDISKLFVSCLDDNIYCYNINKSEDKSILKLSGHKVGEKTVIKISPCGTFLASGSTNDSVFVWDIKNPAFLSIKPLFKLFAHSEEVTLVDWNHGTGDFKLLSASEDNSLRSWRHGHPLQIEPALRDHGYMDILDKEHKLKFTKILDSKSHQQEFLRTLNKIVSEEESEFESSSEDEEYSTVDDEDDDSSIDFEFQSYFAGGGCFQQQSCEDCYSLNDSDEEDYLPDYVWAKLAKL